VLKGDSDHLGVPFSFGIALAQCGVVVRPPLTSR